MTQAGLLVPPWPTDLLQAQQTFQEGRFINECAVSVQLHSLASM